MVQTDLSTDVKKIRKLSVYTRVTSTPVPFDHVFLKFYLLNLRILILTPEWHIYFKFDRYNHQNISSQINFDKMWDYNTILRKYYMCHFGRMWLNIKDFWFIFCVPWWDRDFEKLHFILNRPFTELSHACYCLKKNFFFFVSLNLIHPGNVRFFNLFEML